MSVQLEPATPDDADVIATLRNAVADDLTARHGKGVWSGHCTFRGVRFDQRTGTVWLARREGRVIAALKLATKKPWAIDRSYFTAVSRPLYLTALTVAPDRQRLGIGRACLAQAAVIARDLPADAICLDAFDHPGAGAGPFYAKCGYRETGRVVYHGVPLRYFEKLL